MSRELAELTRQGLIERRGSELILRDVRALARLVEEALEEPPEEADVGLRRDLRCVNNARSHAASHFCERPARPS